MSLRVRKTLGALVSWRDTRQILVDSFTADVFRPLGMPMPTLDGDQSPCNALSVICSIATMVDVSAF